jgi:hypothetical protein
MVWTWPPLAKKRKNKKCCAGHLVWPCLPKGQNFKENENVTQAIWSGHGHQWQKKETQNMSRMPSGLAVIAIGQKKMKNEKCHARNMVWL